MGGWGTKRSMETRIAKQNKSGVRFGDLELGSEFVVTMGWWPSGGTKAYVTYHGFKREDGYADMANPPDGFKSLMYINDELKVIPL